jgi:hypothetical protein
VHDRIRLSSLAQLPVIDRHGNGQMHIVRGRDTKGLLQANLPGGRVKQISAAYDLAYTLECIVHNDGQLIGVQAVRRTVLLTDDLGRLVQEVAGYQLDTALPEHRQIGGVLDFIGDYRDGLTADRPHHGTDDFLVGAVGG